MLLFLPGCATPPSGWPLERAQQLRSEGRLESALRITEQELQRRYDDPDPTLVDLHVEILRDMDRSAEADSFREFVDRYGSGIDTYEVTSGLTWKDCRKSQPGFDLVLEWGDPGDRPFLYPLDDLAATFSIDSQGNVGDITVVRARHPGEAWLVIRSLGTTKVSPWRLEERNLRDPASFPIPLCVWWSF